MVDATGYFGGNYLKAVDIREATQLTITRAQEEEMPDGRKKIVVYFDEVEKGLVLNKINTTRIIKWTGTPETDEWAGTRITVVKSTVEYDGEDVPGIRVKRKPEAP